MISNKITNYKYQINIKNKKRGENNMQVFKVEQWMNKDIKTLNGNNSCVEAAELMRNHNIGCVLIVENDNPVGIISERDLIRKVLATRINPEQTLIESVMSRNIISVDINAEIKEVSRSMVAHGIKKMPVVENGKLKGIITTTDIVRVLSQFNKLYDAKEIIELGA